MTIGVSVRNLVEFILRNGDIDNRFSSLHGDAMAEGSRIHRKIQKSMGSFYSPEVPLKHRFSTDRYDIEVEGRADGIFELEDGGFCIDEIKGTYRDVKRLREADPVHLAQAKCYAYMYLAEKQLETIKVRVTYCNMDTEELQYFYSTYSADEITDWYVALLTEYKRWTDLEFDWAGTRTESIRSMTFPFAYREGQKELVGYAYRTIQDSRKLFLEAPTGVGKTISVLYPSLKAMGENQAKKIFYLTAKTITRGVAADTLNLLRERALRIKSIVLTAKEKICVCEKCDCNPGNCERARGHFDRVNGALYDLLTSKEEYSREVIEAYARKHQVCPFEFSLDVSLFCDCIIGDYNYLFDPHASLKRYFSEGDRGDYIFLIDEAHNLLDRGRAMYSATLVKEDFLECKHALKPYEAKHGVARMIRNLDKCNRELLKLKRETKDYATGVLVDPFAQAVYTLTAAMDDFLEDESTRELHELILDFYFELAHFNLIYELLDRKYVIYTNIRENGSFAVNLYNVDPSTNLRLCMEKGRSSILFSATLLPIQFYKALLGGTREDYEAYAKSTFDPGRRGIFIVNDVSTKYTKRSGEMYRKIAHYLHLVTERREGNYMVFFPSYAFANRVEEAFREEGEEGVELLVQKSSMTEDEKEAFLARFRGNAEANLEELIHFPIEVEETPNTLIGFCVMGGMFSEGIDLKGESLIGAIIVGPGLPMVCEENEILKNYFDENGNDGFEYAYKNPGMNKVLQAAGRVIRTHEDVGIVALLDDRFLQPGYRRLFPREWEQFEVVNEETIVKRMDRFWDEWL